MKHIKPLLFLIILCFSILSCKQQQARMPISHSSGVFLKQSVERNKKLIKEEEKKIDSIIKSDSKINYLASKKGYWYYYISQNEMDNTFPEKGDIVTYTYEIKNLSNQVIYSEKELGEQKYIVDKQEILMGLRDGIKLMHQNETVQFLFPSHMAFGYHGFSGYSCISLNDVVVHGIPSAKIFVKEDDLVKVDICVSYKGFCADMARPFYKKNLEAGSAIERIVACGQYALAAGFAECYAGNHLGTLSHAIEQQIISKGFSVVTSFCGHGIGKKMHEEPLVPNYGIKGKGMLLKHGMGLAIEPMYCLGSADLVIDPVDKWSAKTKDKMLTGHIEDTVIVTEQELIVVTRPEYSK